MRKWTRLSSSSSDGRAWWPRPFTEPSHDVTGSAIPSHAYPCHHGRAADLGRLSGDRGDSSTGKLCPLARRDCVWVHAHFLGRVGGGTGDATANVGWAVPTSPLEPRPLVAALLC